MKNTKARAFSFLSTKSIVAGCFTAALSLSVGCAGNEGDEKDKESSGTTAGADTGSTAPGDTSETKEGDTTQAPAEPTEKKVQLKISDAPEDLSDVRVVVHPELDFTQQGSKLGDALADAAVAVKDDALLDLTVKPIAKDVDLGDSKVTLLYVSMYKDVDKSESYTDGDLLIGSVVESLAYAREGNAKKLPEWTHLDMESGKLVEVKKPLEMKRLDNVKPVESLTLPLKTEKIVEEATHLALLSPKEAKDFSANFLEDDRGELLKVDREKKEHTLTLSAAPAKGRQGSEAVAYLPRFKNMSINRLAGFKSAGDEVTKDSELMGLGCVVLEFQGKSVSDPMIALWIEPGENWVGDPGSAYEALIDGYRPGWNPVAVQKEEDGSLYAYRIGDEDMGLLAVSKDCKAD